MFADILNLIRVRQYYKNVIVFLALILAGNFILTNIILAILAFISISLISSVNYIINDIFDREKDRADSVKKNRAVASGRISVPFALFLSFILFSLSIYTASLINYKFLILVIIMFVLTFAYSSFLKHKIFLDVIMIAINFMIRAVAGAVAIGVFITPWFVIGIFFLAMMLVFVKRYGESLDGAQKNRKTLEFYTTDLMKIFIIVFLSIVILLYSLYIIDVHPTYYFIATIPLFTYLMLRYFSLIITDSDLARHAEKLFLRYDLIAFGVLWVVMFLLALYI